MCKRAVLPAVYFLSTEVFSFIPWVWYLAMTMTPKFCYLTFILWEPNPQNELEVGSLESNWAWGQSPHAGGMMLSQKMPWQLPRPFHHMGMQQANEIGGKSPSPQALICMSLDTVLSRHLDSDKQNTAQHQKAPTLCIASINQGNMT